MLNSASASSLPSASVAYFGERGLSGGGSDSTRNTIEYITIATTGNGTDFGDLTQAMSGCAGMSNGSRGVFTKGNFGTSGSGNTIDYVTIATTGNAIDFGDTLLVVTHQQHLQMELEALSGMVVILVLSVMI